MSTRAIDAVSLSIMWDRLVGITDEIISALMRSSFSTIVRESADLSVVVLDTERERSVAQGSYSVPSFTGTASATLRHMLAKFPPESLEPGDVIATNDAWMGTGHLFDINVMRPVFRNGRIAGYTMSITHLPDIGGLGFGAAAKEIFHEGLRLPNLQARARGTARRADARRHPHQRSGPRAGVRRPHGEHHLQRGRGASAPGVHGRARARRPRAALGRHPRPERAGHPGAHRRPPRRRLRGRPRHRGHRRRASPRVPRRDRRRRHRARFRRHLAAGRPGHQRAAVLHPRHGPLRREVPHRAGHAQQRRGGDAHPGPARRRTAS